MISTHIKLALRDTLYYKLLPFVLKVAERVEAPRYRRQMQLLEPLPKERPQGKAHLFIAYGRGGGADKHVDDAAATIEANGGTVWIMRFNPLSRCFAITHKTIHAEAVKFFRFPSQFGAMVEYLRTLGFVRMDVHHTRYLPYVLLNDLAVFAQLLGVPFDYTFHDFLPICPRVHLMGGDFHYCGMPQDARICDRCIAKNGALTVIPQGVAEWRSLHWTLFKKASALIAPCRDTSERYQRILGELNITVRPHDAPSVTALKLVAKQPNEPYVVAVIGRIHRHKGADVLLACARDAAARGLPLRFTVIGDSVYEDALRGAGVSVTGAYREENLQQLLSESGCSLVFLPSVWPETYSYVLSHIWQGGHFPVAFDLGAPAERIRAARYGLVLPQAMIDSPSSVNDKLLEASRERHAS